MPNLDTIRNVLESDQTIQRLAAVEHERWAHWQQYVHEHCERLTDGSLIIPPELVARWETQIATPYSELSEKEKKSDEDQVRLYLPVVIEALTT
jgi:hypothetical protein